MNYIEQHINIAKNIYKQFISNEQTVKAVAISGSVARGYADQYSDVDILVFDTSLEVYRKKYLVVENTNVEVHYIPLSMVDILYSSISDLIIANKKLKVDIKNTLVLGEKRCLSVKDNPSSLRKVLANWRELKKVFDGHIIWEKDNWYANMKKKYPLLPNFKKINETIKTLSAKSENPIENFLSMIRLYMVENDSIFSKVLWIDRYLENELRVIKDNIYNVFLPLPKDYADWFAKTEERLSILQEKHKSKLCEQCHGDMNKCCVARYSEHFLRDAKRAKDNHYSIGMILSLFRSNENMEKLSEIDDVLIPPLPQSYTDYFNLTMNKMSDNLIKISNTLLKTPGDRC